MAADTLGLSLDSLPQATSEAREEPLPSTQAVIDTPPDPASLPVHAPTGQTPPPEPGHLLPEVEMAEAPVDGEDASHNPYFDAAAPVNGDVNGDHEMSEVTTSVSEPVMHATVKTEADEQPMQTSVSFPGATSSTIDAATFHNLTNGNTNGNGNVRPHPDSDDGAPPAKRARKLSDPDSASLSHTNGASAPPSSSTAWAAHSPPLSIPQHRFMLATVRTLKRMKEAGPFLQPVDPNALGIPHYPTIITHPMDLGTVERKLQASNPTKPDANSVVGRYSTVDEFTADIRLIFANCEKFNGPEHAVTLMGKRVEQVFDKQIRQLPASEDIKPIVKKQTSPLPPAPAPVPPKKAPVRRPSAAQPALPAPRRSDPDLAAASRPKREIHPPAPKDLNYPELPKRTRVKKKDDGTQEQLKFCSRLIQEMYKKQHWQIAAPFYEPVDWNKLDIPSYPKIIKKPMDLLTMKKKLDNHQYSDALKFYADFKLMIRNCFTFNPPGTPVNNAGQALAALFEEKWAALPPLREVQSDNDDDDDESDEDDDTINALTSQLESVKSDLAAHLKKKSRKKEDKKRKVPSQPKASGSGSKAYNGGGGSSKKKKPRVTDADEVLSFDQKKELSETIQTLEGQKLERVIAIIHEGVPDIRNSTEEIELDIDQLPPAVLLKLYNTVMRPIKAKSSGRPSAGPARHSSHGGTGGLKRKSMDEEAEAERIRLLEERIRLFDKDPAAAQGQGSGASSDSSDSDSSSDSD